MIVPGLVRDDDLLGVLEGCGHVGFEHDILDEILFLTTSFIDLLIALASMDDGVGAAR